MDNGQAQVHQVSDRIRFDLLSPSKVRSKESSFVPPLSLSMPPRGLGRSAVLTSDIAVPFVSRRLVVLPCGWNLLPLVLLLAPSAQCWSGFVHSFRPGLSIRRRSAVSLRQPRSASSSSYVSSVNSGAAAPTSTSSPACLGYSVRDSFALIVLGDLHLEDDLTCHRQARDDCLHALKQLSLLPTPQPPPPPAPLVGGDNGSSDSRRGATDTATPPITVQELLKELDDARAGDLSEAQLELLLARRRDGDLLQCYMASLGDLGRKDIRHLPGDAGTTQSFLDAKEYLDSFGIPYELVRYVRVNQRLVTSFAPNGLLKNSHVCLCRARWICVPSVVSMDRTLQISMETLTAATMTWRAWTRYVRARQGSHAVFWQTKVALEQNATV